MAQVIKREDIVSVVRTYKDANGQDKRVYKQVGDITTWKNDDGSESKTLTLHFLPGTKFGIFAQKPRDGQAATSTAPVNDSDNINIEDIPF